MLGKLIKHEWKGTYKIGCLMILALAVISFFGWLAFQTPMWQQLSGEEYYGELSTLDLLSLVTLMMYAFMLVGVSYGTIIYMAVRFYRTMYTDQGYLTHTLPVSKNKILISKILVSGIWYVLITIGILISVVILMVSLFSVVLPDVHWNDIAEFFELYGDEFVAVLRDELGINLAYWGVLLIVSSIVAPFCTMTIIFGAISIGQLFTKHRVLMAIVSYVVISILNMVVSSAVQSATSMNALVEMTSETTAFNNYMNNSVLSAMGLSLFMAVVLYLVSYFVTSRKLNME